MNVSLNDTVTIALSTYEEMRGEIIVLKEELEMLRKEKTIIETVHPKFYEIAGSIMLFITIVLFLFKVLK